MELIENIPLDTHAVANLIRDHDDLRLVWPIAKYPFDHDQWREALDPDAGNKPFLVYEDDLLIGHAALRVTEEPEVYAVSYLYLLPQIRSKGMGQRMISLIERYAKINLLAKKLILYVRTYNPRALKCYIKSGFQEDGREGTLIRMSKMLEGSPHAVPTKTNGSKK